MREAIILVFSKQKAPAGMREAGIPVLGPIWAQAPDIIYYSVAFLTYFLDFLIIFMIPIIPMNPIRAKCCLNNTVNSIYIYISHPQNP